jgi:hypothetical protein
MIRRPLRIRASGILLILLGCALSSCATVEGDKGTKRECVETDSPASLETLFGRMVHALGDVRIPVPERRRILSHLIRSALAGEMSVVPALVAGSSAGIQLSVGGWSHANCVGCVVELAQALDSRSNQSGAQCGESDAAEVIAGAKAVCSGPEAAVGVVQAGEVILRRAQSSSGGRVDRFT